MKKQKWNPKNLKTDLAQDGDTDEYQLLIYLKTKKENTAEERASFLIDMVNKKTGENSEKT